MKHPKRRESSGVGSHRRMLVRACLVSMVMVPGLAGGSANSSSGAAAGDPLPYRSAAHGSGGAASPAARSDAADGGQELFRRARALEREGRMREALAGYLDSADLGYGPAQRRLGTIYGAGSDAVPRDYAKSIQWFRKARENGERVPEPRTYRLPMGYYDR